jgi:hypothetical protein
VTNKINEKDDFEKVGSKKVGSKKVGSKNKKAPTVWL